MINGRKNRVRKLDIKTKQTLPLIRTIIYPRIINQKIHYKTAQLINTRPPKHSQNTRKIPEKLLFSKNKENISKSNTQLQYIQQSQNNQIYTLWTFEGIITTNKNMEINLMEFHYKITTIHKTNNRNYI